MGRPIGKRISVIGGLVGLGRKVTTPGMRSSEFLATICSALLLKLGIFTPVEAAAVAAYVVSRGLAKLGSILRVGEGGDE